MYDFVIVEAWFKDGSGFRAVSHNRGSCLDLVAEHELKYKTKVNSILITTEIVIPPFPEDAPMLIPSRLAFIDRIDFEPKKDGD